MLQLPLQLPCAASSLIQHPNASLSSSYLSETLHLNCTLGPLALAPILQTIRLRQIGPGSLRHSLNLETSSLTDGNLSVLGEAVSVSVFQASSDAHLLAACNLRVRTFYKFGQTYRIEEHYKLMAELEFEALKEKIEGKRLGYGNVFPVLATVSLLDVPDINDELLSLCKVNEQTDGTKDQLVVGAVDLNQTVKLPDELCGTRPKSYEGGESVKL